MTKNTISIILENGRNIMFKNSDIKKNNKKNLKTKMLNKFVKNRFTTSLKTNNKSRRSKI